MLPSPPFPSRPEPTSDRARQVLEWAEVAAYVAWLGIWTLAAVLMLTQYGPEALQLLAR